MINKATKGCVHAGSRFGEDAQVNSARKDGLAGTIEGTEVSEKFLAGMLLVAYLFCCQSTVRRGFLPAQLEAGNIPRPSY